MDLFLALPDLPKLGRCVPDSMVCMDAREMNTENSADQPPEIVHEKGDFVRTCPDCHGTTRVPITGSKSIMVPCETCQYTGWIKAAQPIAEPIVNYGPSPLESLWKRWIDGEAITKTDVEDAFDWKERKGDTAERRVMVTPGPFDADHIEVEPEDLADDRLSNLPEPEKTQYDVLAYVRNVLFVAALAFGITILAYLLGWRGEL